MLATVSVWLDRFLGPDASLRGPALLVLTLAAMWIGYRLSRRALIGYMKARAQKQENIDNFLLIYRYLWLSSAVVFSLVSLSGSLAGLGLSAAFVGMILGWSLQAPVTGVAAWLMIILKRPFKIGDRVIISGITGDVNLASKLSINV